MAVLENLLTYVHRQVQMHVPVMRVLLAALLAVLALACLWYRIRRKIRPTRFRYDVGVLWQEGVVLVLVLMAVLVAVVAMPVADMFLLPWVLLMAAMLASWYYGMRQRRVWTLKRWLRHHRIKLVGIERLDRVGMFNCVRYRIVCCDSAGQERTGVAHLGGAVHSPSMFLPSVRVEWDQEQPAGQ